MNKGLELIEACFMFGLPPSRVDIVVHPQSVVHSMVEYIDGSVLAQLACPDMRTPIAYGMAWPERIEAGTDFLDLIRTRQLDFVAPDTTRFPCLALARAVADTGGLAPAILNAANEVAVTAFLERRLNFPDIPAVIECVLSKAVGAKAAGGKSAVSMMCCRRMPKRATWPWSSAAPAAECRGRFVRSRSRQAFPKRRPPYLSNNTRAGNLFMKRFGLVTTLALCAGSAVCSAQTPPPAPPTPRPQARCPARWRQRPPPLTSRWCWRTRSRCRTARVADFAVTNIRIEGLQRISEGTVYNYLPVNIGDHVTPIRVREAVRSLYNTGFFRDVQMRRDGSTLVVLVVERPAIESFEITATRTSRPRICRSRCARWVWPPARHSIVRCSKR